MPKRFSDEKCLVSYKKGEHFYVFVHGNSDEQLRQVFRQIGRMAVDPELNFKWADAVKVCATIRKEQSNGQPNI